MLAWSTEDNTVNILWIITFILTHIFGYTYTLIFVFLTVRRLFYYMFFLPALAACFLGRVIPDNVLRLIDQGFHQSVIDTRVTCNYVVIETKLKANNSPSNLSPNYLNHTSL